MAKQQLPPGNVVILESLKCTVCAKVIGYHPAAPMVSSHPLKAEMVTYCSENCAHQELQEEPTKLYRFRK